MHIKFSQQDMHSTQQSYGEKYVLFSFQSLPLNSQFTTLLYIVAKMQ